MPGSTILNFGEARWECQNPDTGPYKPNLPSAHRLAQLVGMLYVFQESKHQWGTENTKNPNGQSTRTSQMPEEAPQMFLDTQHCAT